METNTLRIIVYAAFAIVFLFIIPGYFDRKICKKIDRLASQTKALYLKEPGKFLTVYRLGEPLVKAMLKSHYQEYVSNPTENPPFNETWFYSDLGSLLFKFHLAIFGGWYVILIGLIIKTNLNSIPSLVDQASQAIK